MTDQTITEADFDLDEFLATGTLARRSVAIYNRPDLAAEYDRLAARLTDAQTAAAVATAGDGGDRSLGSQGPVDDVLAAMEDLHEQWLASRTWWTVRALTEDDIASIVTAIPDPPIPALLGADRPKIGTPEWDERQRLGAEFVKAREAVVSERNFAMIALAVVRIESSSGTKARRIDQVTGEYGPQIVTVEQVRRLRARPHGKAQTQRLLDAVESATSGEVDVPRPTSRASSADVLG